MFVVLGVYSVVGYENFFLIIPTAMDPMAADAARLQRELQEVEAKLRAFGALPTDAKAPAAAATLNDTLERCHFLLLPLPVNALVSLMCTSKKSHKIMLTSWRKLYSAGFPHEIPLREGLIEPRHPLSPNLWQRLYFERLLDGAATVPCFLHEASNMASATLDPGAVRLIEAYLRRLTQKFASMHSALVTPPDEPGLRESALAECGRLIDSEAPSVRAAKMVLKTLESNHHAFGCDGTTVALYEQEAAQLSKRHRELASTRVAYQRFKATGAEGAEALSSTKPVGRAAAPSTESLAGTQAAGGGGVETAENSSTSSPRPLPTGVRLQVGAAVEAIREEGDDEWERASVMSINIETGTVALMFDDRFRAPRVPLDRVRALSDVGDDINSNSGASPPSPVVAPPPPPVTPPVGIREHVPTLVRKRVRIDGLVARPALNGTYGLAISFDAQSGRYGVRLEVDGTRVALRPDNLTRADGWIGPSPPRSAERPPAKQAPLPSQEQAKALYEHLFAERAAGVGAGKPQGRPATASTSTANYRNHDEDERIVDVTDD